MNITVPDGYRILSYAVAGLGNRMYSWDISTSTLAIYNQGGSTYSITFTLYVNFVRTDLG